MVRLMSLALLLPLVGVLVGCTTDKPDPGPIEVTFSRVVNGGTGPYWQPGGTARGEISEFGTTITVPVTVENANGIYFRPVVTITAEDGSTYTCEEDDPRRHPALVRSTTEFEVPCPAGIPSSGKGATVSVVDPEA